MRRTEHIQNFCVPPTISIQPQFQRGHVPSLRQFHANSHATCMHVETEHFNWGCANVLVGVGDPYSTAAAKAFESAAIDNQIDVCTKANYEAGSSDMAAPIRQIINNRCCRVTVVFGQTQDLSSLLLEAHRQNYAGEWIMGDNIMGSLDTIVNDLNNNHLDEISTHRLLRGMFEFVLTEE